MVKIELPRRKDNGLLHKVEHNDVPDDRARVVNVLGSADAGIELWKHLVKLN